MPVPVQSVCPKCKGQTDVANYPCIPCTWDGGIAKPSGWKKTPSSFFRNPKKDEPK